ncbi:DUF1080 domain-containing protein [Roseivirga sp. BDSF3-8]|uniref:3-keto-disaccharide hydrolase n=1 Tax=Roseivirga sp. BDSF3-8 TaxID=3241598 RepID=UPI00353245C0
MKNIYLSFAVASCMLVACEGENKNSNQDNQTAMTEDTTQSSQPESEWITLFDGESLQGWHRYGGEPVGDAWKAVDGTLHLDTADAAYANGGGGDIVTDEEFEDFHLELEWKISENGNSGIMFYVNEDTSKYQYPYESGPEMQVLHDEGHPDGQIDKHQAGDLYDLIRSQEKAAKGPGEWNKVDIIAQDGNLELKLNGTTTVQTTMWDDNWRDLIAGSKFAEWDGFGTYKKGHIVLQDHDDNVWFRNIRIKRL